MPCTTGNRADRNEGVGNESLHVAIDDHSRLGFACVRPDEKIPSTSSAFFIQSLCREWAYTHAYYCRSHRTEFLPHYLNMYI